jgi:hypothetical protein
MKSNGQQYTSCAFVHKGANRRPGSESFRVFVFWGFVIAFESVLMNMGWLKQVKQERLLTSPRSPLLAGTMASTFASHQIKLAKLTNVKWSALLGSFTEPIGRNSTK